MAVALLVAILCLLFAMLCLLFAFISDKETVIRQGSSFISAFSLAICVLVMLPFIPGVVAKIPPLGQDGRVCVEINEYFEAAAEICHKFNPCLYHLIIYNSKLTTS
ncbi:uncharacterized protein N7469_009523 [Penicillium citrinum]|uniref:Uncharacterized protein n=1 Tax=Penicillium citrinum TaxID=5077 RepID=A0A9W9NIH9_PENCI|nr:uncharacterized protein N7469_009523 [Penicillium citrinum]KAJ5220636.1 hypothetical protein N7469_009523 [Penicillium citrinum]